MSNIRFIVRSFIFLMECQLSEYFFPMNTDDSNVENMNIHHITECFPLSSVTSIEDRFCLFRTWSFTLFKNDLDPNDNSDSVSSFFFFFKNDVFGLLMRETWLKLVCSCPRANNECHRSIIHQFISFPLLRRPSFVIVPLVPFWVSNWVRAFNELVFVALRVTGVTANNGFHRSIINLIFRTQGTSTFITSLPRGFLMQKMTELREPLQLSSSLASTLLWLFLHLILLAFFLTSLQSNL